MRCIVLANCTHSPMKEYIAASGVFETVDHHAVFSLSTTQRDDLALTVREYDCVISASHSDSWGGLSKAALKTDLGERCVIYTTPFFCGLHPDLVHLSVDNLRQSSVLGPYHSGLILWGYLNAVGLNVLNEMYHDGVLPEEFDIEKVWDRDIAELRSRDAQNNISTADIYDRMCREGPEMLTFNHPSMAILGEIAHRALARLGFQLPKIATSTVYNHLLRDIVFPVSPAARKAFDLSYVSPQKFRAELHAKNASQYVSFRQFAEASYDQYNSLNGSTAKITTPASMTSAFKPWIAGWQERKKA